MNHQGRTKFLCKRSALDKMLLLIVLTWIEPCPERKLATPTNEIERGSCSVARGGSRKFFAGDFVATSTYNIRRTYKNI